MAEQERDAEVQRARAAARESDWLGPGTAGQTTSGAAYRGQEVAAQRGVPSPADPGFTQNTGLGYVDRNRRDRNEYPPTDAARQ